MGYRWLGRLDRWLGMIKPTEAVSESGVFEWESEVCGEDVTDLTVREFREESGLTVSKRYATLRQVSVVPEA